MNFLSFGNLHLNKHANPSSAVMKLGIRNIK
jgi:hypothetical protein